MGASGRTDKYIKKALLVKLPVVTLDRMRGIASAEGVTVTELVLTACRSMIAQYDAQYKPGKNNIEFE